MAYSVEDLVNMALEQIGYPKRVADIYEGSPAARAALDIYGQTRDELLQSGDWPFALREVLLITAGQTPPTPWTQEFSYPADCLRIRYIRPGPLTGGTRSLDPQPVLYRTWNDQRPSTPIRAILCDLTSAVIIYSGKITDPATWEPGFTHALVDALAKKLAFRLAQSRDMISARIGLAQQSVEQGLSVDDMTPPTLPMTMGQTQPQRGQ